MSLTAMPYGRGPAGWPTVSLGIFADLPVAVALVTGPDLVVQAANDRYLALVGGEELAGRSLSVALPEFSAQEIVGLCRQVLESGEPAWRHELPTWTGHHRGRLERVFVDAFYQPLRDAAGTVIGVLFFGADVTAQVLARQGNEELTAVKDRYETLFGSLPFGVIRYSADGLILEANPAASEIIGLPTEELLTWPLSAAAGAVREDGTPLSTGELSPGSGAAYRARGHRYGDRPTGGAGQRAAVAEGHCATRRRRLHARRPACRPTVKPCG